jgi:hypothetical protein
MIKEIIKKLKNLKRFIWKRKLHAIVITADVKHIRDGEVIWEAKNLETRINGLMDEGENLMLDVFFRNATAPSSFYLGLGNNGGTPGVPNETATLSSITEVSGTGYARQTIERSSIGFPILQKDTNTGDWEVISKDVTFTNTGTSNWTAADYLFLTDVASGTSGKLIATVATSISRVLVPNDSLVANIKIRLA